MSDSRPSGPKSGITELLRQAGGGDRAAMDRVFDQVHAELRRVARSQLSRERKDHTLTPTALVHEAYLKLVAHTPNHLHDRQHFFAIAARAMRQVLVSYAERRAAIKRGADEILITFEDSAHGTSCRAEQLLNLHRALDDLQRLDPQLAQIVEYRFFAGLGQDEIASVLGVSPSTVGRGWRTARAGAGRCVTGRSWHHPRNEKRQPRSKTWSCWPFLHVS